MFYENKCNINADPTGYIEGTKRKEVKHSETGMTLLLSLYVFQNNIMHLWMVNPNSNEGGGGNAQFSESARVRTIIILL